MGYALSVAGTSLRVSGAVPAQLVVLDDVSRVPCGRVDSACQTLHWARGWLWVFAIFPVLYGVCDIVENILLARLMFRPTTVTVGSVALAQTVTRLKFTAVTIGVLQLIVLLVSWLLGTLVHELR